MRNAHLTIAALAFAAASCTKPTDVTCQPGYALCGAGCVRIGADPANCGACGHACGPREACVSAACVPDCRASLHAPIDDPWGASWDGIQRPAASYLTARTACEDIGGRLPTASEIVRAGARSAAVGDLYQSSLLWTLPPLDATNGLAVRLSNGSSTAYPLTSAAPNYRCLCPPARPGGFTGSACFTAGLGDGCAAFPGDARLNVDAEERAPLPRVAAEYECALAGGALMDSDRLVAALASGLPNLTGAMLWTADAIASAAGNLLVASAASPSYAMSANAAEFHAFRCMGPAALRTAATVPGGFREPRGERVADGTDRAAAAFPAALFDCLSRGGHLPTGAELATLALQGLPANGVTTARWTADEAGAATVETFAWPGAAYWPVDPDLAATVFNASGISLDGTTDARSAKTASLPYRCVYYAVDPTYAAPSASACGAGGCLAVAVGTRAHMWFQNRPHGGTASDTYASAVSACAALGGRLPTTRDLMEAIHAGLDDQINAVIITSDFLDGATVRALQWNAPYPTDPEPGATAAAIADPSSSYLCMWTDELR